MTATTAPAPAPATADLDAEAPRIVLTPRERERLYDLLGKWACVDDPELTGTDRDMIGQLRHLLDTDR